MPQIRIAAYGLVPSLALLGALVLLPHALSGNLSEERAEKIVGDYHRHRQVRAVAERAQGAPPSEYPRLEKDFTNATKVQFSSVDVRRSLMVPPFSRRTAFIVRTRLRGATESKYFRVRGSSVYQTSEIWWHLRL